MDYLSLHGFSYDDSGISDNSSLPVYDISGLCDGSRLSDEDSLDREELEVALYSQIHFETNLDCEGQNDLDSDCNKYVLKVEGNLKTGCLLYKSTPDIILNDLLMEKYADNVCDNSVIYAGESHNQNVLEKSTNYSGDTPDKSKEENSTVVHRDTSVKNEQQIKNNRDKKKSNLGEKLMLGVSESDGSDVEIISSEETSDIEIEITSDDDDEDDDGDFINKKGENSRGQKTRKVGHFVEAQLDDTDDSDFGDLYIGTSDNVKKHADIQFNIDGGVLPSDESDQESVNEEDWKISYADTKSFNPNRYFKPVICYNCKEKGHTSKMCQKPKKEVVCILCSEEGHISRNCPESFCYNCLETGHSGKDCKRYRNQRYIKCHRCKMEGHEAQRCPDEWRQYHLTIKPGKLVQGRPRRDVPISCYNCGEDDHLGHECEEEGGNRFVRFTTPFVCVYRQHRLYKDCVGSIIRGPDVENYKQPSKKQKKQHSSARTNTKSLIRSDNSKHKDDTDLVQSTDISFKKPRNVSLFVPFGKESYKSRNSERSNPESFKEATSIESVNSVIEIPDNNEVSTGIELSGRCGKRGKKKDKMMKKMDRKTKKNLGNTDKQSMVVDQCESFVTGGMEFSEHKAKNRGLPYYKEYDKLYNNVPSREPRNKQMHSFKPNWKSEGKNMGKNKQKFNKRKRDQMGSSMTMLKDGGLNREIPSNNNGFRTNLNYKNVTLDTEKNKLLVNNRGFKCNLNYESLSKNRTQFNNIQITVGNSRPREVEKNGSIPTPSNVGMFKKRKQKRKMMRN